VDPVADLRPVCPNCHAVIHLGGACRSIDEVRQHMQFATKPNQPAAPSPSDGSVSRSDSSLLP
jgi:hypothetical protein